MGILISLAFVVFVIAAIVMIVSRLGRRNRLADIHHRQMIGVVTGDPLAGYADHELVNFNGKVGTAGSFRAARAHTRREPRL